MLLVEWAAGCRNKYVFSNFCERNIFIVKDYPVKFKRETGNIKPETVNPKLETGDRKLFDSHRVSCHQRNILLAEIFP